MDLICKNCHKPFNLGITEVAGATVDFAVGMKHTFVCDHCKEKNVLTKAEYEAAKDAFEAGAKPAMAGAPRASAAPAPAKPAAAMPAAKPMMTPHGKDEDAMPAPKSAAGMTMKAGTVLVASLHVRKDHSTSAETVKGLVKGDKVTIMTTWTDGTNTWAQIGENEWAAIEHGGKKMIELN